MLTIPSEYAKEDRSKKDTEMKIVRRENKEISGVEKKKMAVIRRDLSQMKTSSALFLFLVTPLLQLLN